MGATSDNGLGNYMALANLTVVGALVLVFVVFSIWAITRGIPRVFSLFSEQLASHAASAETQRKDFLNALSGQTAARVAAASEGHAAALAIADSLKDVVESLDRLRTTLHDDAANGNKRPDTSNANGRRSVQIRTEARQ